MAKKSIFCWRNIIIVILLTPIVFYVISLVTVSYQLNSIKKELRADGKPVTFEDLAKIAAEYDNRENAIDYIIEAGNLEEWPQEPNPPMPLPVGDMMGMSGGMSTGTPASIVEEKEPPVYGYKPKDMYNLSDKERINLKRYLEANKYQLEALDKAIEIGWYKVRVNWQDRWDALVPDLPKIKDATRLVTYKAIEEANKGNIQNAIELVSNWYQVISDSMTSNPYTQIETTISCKCFTILDECILWILKEKELSKIQLEQLYKTISTFNYKTILDKAMDNEHVRVFECLGDFQSFNSSYSYVSELDSMYYTYSGLTKLNVLYFYYLSSKSLKTNVDNFYSYFNSAKSYENELIALKTKKNYKPLELVSLWASMTYKIGRTISDQQLIKIAITNELYRKEYGEYAANLEILKKYREDLEVKDIFTRNDLLGYKTITEDNQISGYIIWSLTDKALSDIEQKIQQMEKEKAYYSPYNYEPYKDYAIIRMQTK